MTDRTLTAAVKTEVAASSLTAVLFCELLFATPVRVWTGLGPLTMAMPGEASQTWDGVGDLGSVDAVRESADRRQNGVNISLSGIDNAILADALGEDYQGRGAKLWLAFIDGTGAVIADPVFVFGGLMDVMTVSEGDGAGTISLQCESREAQLGRTSTSLLTDQEQQRLFPGDLGLAFVQQLQSKEIIWGGPSPMPASSKNRGGSGPGNIENDRRSFQVGF